MWPYLFGPGWGWDVLVSAALLAGISGGALAMIYVTRPSSNVSGRAADPIDTIWHRYEEGDLTQFEFERQTRIDSLSAAA